MSFNNTFLTFASGPQWWWFLIIVLIFAAIAGSVFLVSYLFKKKKGTNEKDEIDPQKIAEENMSKYLEEVEDEKTIEEMNKYSEDDK